MAGFGCECGEGEWHDSLVQGDDWKEADVKRDELSEGGSRAVYIVNPDHVRGDRVLVLTEDYAIVESVEE